MSISFFTSNMEHFRRIVIKHTLAFAGLNKKQLAPGNYE